jgi:hypothetical protein
MVIFIPSCNGQLFAFMLLNFLQHREGQEDQLSALGLVTNAVILWNTIYMQASLDHLQQQGQIIIDKDINRLSPLSYKHVNMLGHYSFNLAEHVAKGQLRPLNSLQFDETP